jgi:glycosyltransferase involved in cell wall biosynthesis
VNDLLAAADVGVVAQKASSYSHLVHTNKVMEYWMFGLPVIHSRLRATEEVYDDSVLEYFVPGDAQSLAAAIRRLREDPERHAELIRNGERAFEQYGWPAQQLVYLSVYERVLNGAGP